ncbi:hypothetical protein JCM14635_09400 [Megalodesulfovibrio paquesii]
MPGLLFGQPGLQFGDAAPTGRQLGISCRVIDHEPPHVASVCERNMASHAFGYKYCHVRAMGATVTQQRNTVACLHKPTG